MQRQPQRHIGRGVCLPEGGQQVGPTGRLRIPLVDPVPREVAERDRGQAGPPRRRERERRNIADHQPHAAIAQEGGFGRRPLGERRVEGVGAAQRLGHLEPQAVDLHDPRVGVERRPLDRGGQREVEDPAGRRGADEDADARPRRMEGIDDLDVPRRVAEAVPRYIEGDHIDD